VNVLILSDYFPPNIVGGAELVAWNQFNDLTSQGHKVLVITKSTNGDSTSNNNVFRVSLVDNGKKDVLECAIQIHNTFKIDYVFVHNVRELGNDSLAFFQSLNIPVEVKLHDFNSICNRGTLDSPGKENCSENYESTCFCKNEVGTLDLRMKRDFVRYLSKATVEFVTPSRFYMNMYEEFGVHIARHESNGILDFFEDANLDVLSRCSCPSENHTRFIFTGYLGKHKGIDLIINVFSEVFDDQNGICCLTIVGDGNQENRIDKFAKKYRKNVHKLGRVTPKQADELISLSDCLVLPSIWLENEPVSVLQALSKGKYVITSDAGGNKELFHPNLSCLFKSGDAEQFKQAVSKILNRKIHAGEKMPSEDLLNRLKKKSDHLKINSRELNNSVLKPMAVFLGNTNMIPNDLQHKIVNASPEMYFISSNTYLGQHGNANCYIVIGNDFERRILAHALKAGKIIFTPRVSDFSSSWDSPNNGLMQFSDTEELISGLHRFNVIEPLLKNDGNLLRDLLARSLEHEIFAQELL
jgi:glycosyltransferase involved in cell wall biosynthesis